MYGENLYLAVTKELEEAVKEVKAREAREAQKSREAREARASQGFYPSLAEMDAQAQVVQVVQAQAQEDPEAQGFYPSLVKRKPKTRTETFTVSGQTFHPSSSWVASNDWYMRDEVLAPDGKWYLRYDRRLDDAN